MHVDPPEFLLLVAFPRMSHGFEALTLTLTPTPTPTPSLTPTLTLSLTLTLTLSLTLTLPLTPTPTPNQAAASFFTRSPPTARDRRKHQSISKSLAAAQAEQQYTS